MPAATPTRAARLLLATLAPLQRPDRPVSTPTVTPLPGSARCTTYHPPGTEGPIWDIEVAPDRTVWIAASRGLARLNLRTGQWTTYPPQDGLPDDRVWSVTAGPQGSLWVALRGSEGVANFDGTSWAHYTSRDGLVSDDVRDISIAPDGAVWFATTEGASRWDREENTWTHYSLAEDVYGDPLKRIWSTPKTLYSNQVEKVLFTPDGRIWFVHREALTYLLPAASPDGEDTWGTYGEGLFLAMRKAIVSEDGRLWVGQALFDPARQEWLRTAYRDIHLQGLAVDRRGGLWLARQDGVLYLPKPVSGPRETWRHYGRAEGLAGDDVFVIALESDRAVWFGTRDGASRCILD